MMKTVTYTFLKITSLLILLLFLLNPTSAVSQIYYVSGDTLWVQENAGEEPRFIADGTTLPIRSVAVDESGGFVYWSQAGSFDSEIFRADLDSLNSESIAESPSARGIALDTTQNKIYWADVSNDGAIYQANLDGSDSSVLVAGNENGDTEGILDIDIDAESNTMYWVRRGAVMKGNTDGTEISVLSEMASYIQPSSIVLNADRSYVYWSDTSNDDIRRISTDGSGSAESIADADTPAGIDIDTESGKIFWVEDYLFSGNGGAIYSSNPDGSDKVKVKDISFTRSALYVGSWSVPTSVEETSKNHELPDAISLNSNYPNPFNPQTQIHYELGEPMAVSIDVYNFLGQKVRALISNEMQSVGVQKVTFDAYNLPSGVYIYRISTSKETVTGKMTLLK